MPALLTFFIRLFVPESQSWERERARGATSSWASRDLLTVLGGVIICAGLLFVWYKVDNLAVRLAATGWRWSWWRCVTSSRSSAT